MNAWQPEFELVFNQEVTAGTVQPQPANVFRYRTKTIKSGPYLESEVYPIWATKAETRIARGQVTREAQQKLNSRNALRKLTRLINTNFGSGDLGVTLTYKGEAPDMKQAQKDIRNYIRRLRDWRRKQGLAELKYIYVVEGLSEEADLEPRQLMLGSEPEPPDETARHRSGRVHHHLVINDMDRDVVERLWGKGFANCKRLQPDEFGLEKLARYMIKERSSRRRKNNVSPNPDGVRGNEALPTQRHRVGGSNGEPAKLKRWYGSRNLKQPVVTVSDWKLSRRKVEKVIAGIEDAPGTIFNKAYPGYGLVDVKIWSSEFVSGFYLRATMVRRC